MLSLHVSDCVLFYFVSVKFGLYADGIKRIVKKMRIYLTLQHPVFSLGLAFFRFGNGIYEVVELARQTVEIIEKVAEFILSFL